MFDFMRIHVLVGVNIEIYSSHLSFRSKPDDVDGLYDCFSDLYLYGLTMLIKWILLKKIVKHSGRKCS